VTGSNTADAPALGGHPNSYSGTWTHLQEGVTDTSDDTCRYIFTDPWATAWCPGLVKAEMFEHLVSTVCTFSFHGIYTGIEFV